MKRSFIQNRLPFVAAVFALISCADRLHAVTLTFEGLSNLEPVLNYYNGGFGGSGSGPGPSNGVVFSGNALALIDADAGGTGNIANEPSPSTVLFFLGGSAATLNYESGFDTGFSFLYSAINYPGLVRVYDGLNATGNLLATIDLAVTPWGNGDPNGAFGYWEPIGVSFAGIARSVDFGGTVNQICFDNVTFGSATPGEVPDGGTSACLLGLSLLGLFGCKKLRKS